MPYLEKGCRNQDANFIERIPNLEGQRRNPLLKLEYKCIQTQQKQHKKKNRKMGIQRQWNMGNGKYNTIVNDTV